jgi:hypothetical protein
MNPLDYYLPQPAFELSPAQQAGFDALLASTPPGGWIDYRLDAPKWQFLSYLCQSKNLVLHGSQNLAINEIEPRKALDIRAFSAQEAIYATTDGIWVIYFAIVDRQRFQLSLFNSCVTVRIPSGPELGPLYFFSVTQTALVQNPWCDGAIYILPREHFTQEAPQHMQGAEVIFPHWVSAQPSHPVARLRVGPQDFPFLAQVHGHNEEKLVRLVAADPNGYPWPEALET